jgi:hypothetical protein
MHNGQGMKHDEAQFGLTGCPQKWDEILCHFPHHDIYFSYAYHALCSQTSPHSRPECFYYQAHGETFFLPILKNPLPQDPTRYDFETVYGYSGPLTTCTNENFLADAWQSCKKQGQDKRIICGLIRFHPMLANHTLPTPKWIEKPAIRETVMVDTQQPFFEYQRQLNKGTKSDVSRAERAGVIVQKYSDKAAYLQFHRHYINHMHQLGASASYLFDANYFLNLSKMSPQHSSLYCARINNEPIAGILLLHSTHYSHYHLSWSLQQYRQLSATKLLLHHAIADMAAASQNLFHLGGGTSNLPQDSLLAFKRHFATQMAQFHLGKVLFDEPAYLEICTQWSASSTQHSKEDYGDYFLKYRY